MADSTYKLDALYKELERVFPDNNEREDFFAIELSRSIDARFAMKGKVLSVIEIMPNDDGYLLSAFDTTQIEVKDG